MKLLGPAVRVLGLAFTLTLLLMFPQSVSGNDPVPMWLTRATVPQLQIEGEAICGSVVVGGSLLLTAQHCTLFEGIAVDYGPGFDRSRVDGASCVSWSNDFAVLQTTVPKGIPVLPIWAGALPQPGQMVWVAGYPGGKWTVRQLTISALWAAVTIRGTTPKKVVPVLIGVTDVDLAKGGISGGAMFDVSGNLLGIMVAYQSSRNIAGAVPIQYGVEVCNVK